MLAGDLAGTAREAELQRHLDSCRDLRTAAGRPAGRFHSGTRPAGLPAVAVVAGGEHAEPRAAALDRPWRRHWQRRAGGVGAVGPSGRLPRRGRSRQGSACPHRARQARVGEWRDAQRRGGQRRRHVARRRRDAVHGRGSAARFRRRSRVGRCAVGNDLRPDGRFDSAADTGRGDAPGDVAGKRDRRRDLGVRADRGGGLPDRDVARDTERKGPGCAGEGRRPPRGCGLPWHRLSSRARCCCASRLHEGLHEMLHEGLMKGFTKAASVRA